MIATSFPLLLLLLIAGATCQPLQENPSSVYGSSKDDFVPTYGGGGGGKPATGGSPSDNNGGDDASGGGGGTVPFTGVPLPPFNGGGGGGGGGGSGGGSGGGGGTPGGTTPFIGTSPPSSGGGGAPGGTAPFIGTSPPSSGTSPANPAPSGGCTCFFWANHPELWPPFLTIFSSIASVFQGISPRIFGPGITLLSALRSRGADPFSQLLREGSAALLNSYVHKNFPSSPQFVKARFNSALVSRKAATIQAAKFARMNGEYGRGKLDYCFF